MLLTRLVQSTQDKSVLDGVSKSGAILALMEGLQQEGGGDKEALMEGQYEGGDKEAFLHALKGLSQGRRVVRKAIAETAVGCSRGPSNGPT